MHFVQRAPWIHNKNHRLEKGDRRLTINSDGDEHHYCVACAKVFLAADIKRLQTLLEQADPAALEHHLSAQ